MGMGLKGDDCIIKAVCACVDHLKDLQPSVKVAALRVLERVASPIDEQVLSSVSSCLDAKFHEVQQAAASAFVTMTVKDWSLGVKVLASHLVHAHVDARHRAGMVLSQMAVSAGPDKIVPAVIAELPQGKELLDALTHIELLGSTDAAVAISDHLAHESPDVRAAALKMLARIGAKNKEMRGILAAGIEKTFNDEHVPVRCAALEALAAIHRGAQNSDHAQRCRAIVLAGGRLADADEDVRAA